MQKCLLWIIDDDAINNFLCEKTIKSSGIAADIVTFTECREPLELLKSETDVSKLPDLILLDINLPIFNGWDFLNEFSKIKLHKPTKVAMLTSSVYEKDMDRAKHYEAVVDYFTKPLLKEQVDHLKEKLPMN